MSPSNRDFSVPLEDDNEQPAVPHYDMSVWEQGFSEVRAELEAQIASLTVERNELRDKLNRTGICGNRPIDLAMAPIEGIGPCDLPAGHNGWHGADNPPTADGSTSRATWTHNQAPLMAARLRRARQVIEAAQELPTDHLLSLAVDVVETTRSPTRAAFWQAIVDQIKAFDSMLESYEAEEQS